VSARLRLGFASLGIFGLGVVKIVEAEADLNACR
jgi:hypothetical protein